MDTNRAQTDSGGSSFLHPATGGLILGLDWLLFSGTVVTGAVALPIAVVLGFTVGGLGTCMIQRYWARRACWGASWWASPSPSAAHS
jgi:hypothetical protein